MRAEISALVASVNALKQQNAVLVSRVDAEVANSGALKAALDAAIAGQLSAEERAALEAATGDVTAVRSSMSESAQKLADSAAVNAPSN